MKKPAKASIEVRGTVVNIVTQNEEDYICLTDIARFKDPERTDYLISNWMRNRNTVEFLGIWEQLPHPHRRHQGHSHPADMEERRIAMINTLSNFKDGI